MRTRIRQLNPLVMYLVLFVFSALVAATASVAYAHEFSTPLRFHSTSVNADDRTASYGSEVSAAIQDYDDNTDMTWTDTNDPAVIIYLEGNWGATGWYAGQQALSDSVPCFSWPSLSLTGDCDTAQNKSDFSYIYLNTHYQTDLDDAIEFVVRHEPGHVMGMAHTSCGTNSVMKYGWCTNKPSTLQTHDKNHINDWY